ncbi:hypothetical protein EMIHUDRAFT_115596 [Emiliania huxleyi CCMP1516]|uniref:Uncharacterized protein n=2 Tax=Emiliania huxleyi TaxID=2903 RepID=A0A0D3JP97_EMIH1|nr:hypothetical protein EMIHUDRAFT_115596 [Emiliania huxleyi CCMP1516]EOD25332.1 hypothetical protein EMIHUDRAFT_115596 [Emiliania huxleyi CCMP1516]|eukprot:XP_005777761.1 hypothetical protein EMIHUDRAFT_115596 [Emiliania huxleyi CCMP1516]
MAPPLPQVAVCAVILVLVLLQGALYARRSTWVITQPLASSGGVVSVPESVAGAVPPPGAAFPSAEQVLRRAGMRRVDPPTANASASQAPPSGKDCGEASGEFPRHRILIVHEQHLQSMGCDVRLLRFVKDLVYLNQEVSMLFRGSTPAKLRQPKSKQLASILHIDGFEEDQLRKGLRDPPGLYEWTNATRFAQLVSKGHFNIVIIFLWFWYDPQPSVAELVLPVLRAYAPADKQPFVAVLSDDAHAIRSSRLGEVKISLRSSPLLSSPLLSSPLLSSPLLSSPLHLSSYLLPPLLHTASPYIAPYST